MGTGEFIPCQQAHGEDGKKFGEQSERTGMKLKNSESEAIGASLSGACLQAGEFNAGGYPAINQHPIQRRKSRNTPSRFMLQKPG